MERHDGDRAEDTRDEAPTRPGLGDSHDHPHADRPADLLAAALDGSTLDPARRIFVNRNLRFEHVRQIGFDMDYTLAPYQKLEIEKLSFDLTAKKLVEKLGYPEEVLSLPYDPRFVVRGLVVDKKRGNIFKMDGHNHVGRVYHGRRPLSKEERRELYRNVKIRLSSPKYHWIDTLFALPEAALYADIIDLFELRLGRTPDYWKLFDDIRASIDECHRDGSLKSVVKADLARYIVADPLLPQTLHKLRSAGKKLFLLTNSLHDYTDAVMSFIFNGKLAEYPTWRQFFDIVVVGAGKPSFFTGEAPFHRVELATGVAGHEPVTRFEKQGVYQGGSIELFEGMLGERGEQILYVGDHIYGDIIRSKKDSLWRTALILEDLEDELSFLRQTTRTQADLAALDEHRATLDHEIMTLKLRVSAVEAAIDDHPERHGEQDELLKARRQLRTQLDRKRRDLKAVIERRDAVEREIESSYNPYWGSVFKEGAETSRFGEQVEDYACIYTSRVSNFLAYSPHQYFRAPRHWMPHEKA
ncbi:HAD-IG family 5'-nucleotidase [Myxococcota bacterium]|nr:HAD-IG family 5'-nucleotidase [Myxococcota bacterium]